MTHPNRPDRRRFLEVSALVGGGVVLASQFDGLFTHIAHASGTQLAPNPYGELLPTLDQTTRLPLLRLPQGFTYHSFGWTGDIMTDDTLTPDRHDGMAVVDVRSDGTLVLVRNHERGASEPGNPLPVIGDGKAPIYDTFHFPGAVSGIGGGTTTLLYRNGAFVESRASIAGTLTNCAGGPTPWGSWLTNEEVTIRGKVIGAQDHGYIYEVPSPYLGTASARPIKAMGFFDHEACAVDPRTGFAYLTEDNGPRSGTYRFRPNDPLGGIGSLEKGGVLEMLKVVGVDNADLGAVEQGQSFDVQWVVIDDPDADPEGFESPGPGFPPISGVGRSGCYLQGEAKGGARFVRGEGCWYHEGVVYFVDTSAGPVGKGTVWALEPGAGENGSDRATVIFASPSESVADNPDNVTVSPKGGVVLCEDGGGVRDGSGKLVRGTRLIGLTPDGQPFPVAENNLLLDAPIPGKPFIEPEDYRGREFAGATFDPTGEVLFVNIQTPGITFAIRGPWRFAP